MMIKILLADDHKLLREGLRSLITEQPDMDVVGEAEDGKNAVRLAAKMSPHIVVMDITMPGMNGIEATRQILSANRSTRIIALSMHLESRMVLEMFHAGAWGYLLKDCAFEEVVEALKAVASGKRWLSLKIAETLLADLVHRVPAEETLSLPGLDADERGMLQMTYEGKTIREITARLGMGGRKAAQFRQQVVLDVVVPRLLRAREQQRSALSVSLTSREKEILTWIRDGKSTGEISSVLDISQDTVKYHVKNIFQKLHATSRTQAIAIALENKLIDS